MLVFAQVCPALQDVAQHNALTYAPLQALLPSYSNNWDFAPYQHVAFAAYQVPFI